MAEPTIKIKRSSVAGKTPTISNLTLGELGLNTYDGKLFLKQDQGGVGVGTTVIAVNPWNVGLGGVAYDTYFTAGNVGIGSEIPTSKLDVLGNVKVSGVVTATTFSGNATSATYATTAGVSTYATNAGVTTALQNARTFEITGDVVASSIIFDGTGNVSLAATIQPNSVALGTDTTGDYVSSISGTSNQITVTGGTGEGSTPTLSIPNQFTAPQDVEVTRDLQVNRNLNVNGNITIGGTSAVVFSQSLNIYDPDIVLGFRTDVNGNDVSNDNTANHGGVAIASTEGNPLVQLFIAGIETNPATYKKIMWFKSGEFAGLGTDAWLSNYAVGIGSTQFPTGTRLAAGAVQFTENDLTVVRNINASGIVTAPTVSGINLSYSGVSTFTNGPVLIGSATSTGTASQPLQVTGGGYFSGNVGIGTTNPVSPLEVSQDTTGVHDLTVTNLNTGNNITKASRIRFRLTDTVGTKKDVAYITAYPNDANSAAGNYLSFFTRTADATPTEKLRLDNNGNLVLGSPFTATGTASQPLQVTGGAYVSANLGVGVTNPSTKLDVLGEVTINTSVVYGSTTATTTATTANQSIFDTLSATTYRSVEFLIQATEGTNYQVEKLIMTHNGTTTYDSEYANVINGNLVASYATDISGGNIRLLVTPASANSTTYKIQYTAIKV